MPDNPENHPLHALNVAGDPFQNGYMGIERAVESFPGDFLGPSDMLHIGTPDLSHTMTDPALASYYDDIFQETPSPRSLPIGHLSVEPGYSASVGTPAQTRPRCPEPSCGRTFSRKSDLRRHINNQHNLGIHLCPFPTCDRSGRYGFKRRDKLLEHIRKAHPGHEGNVIRDTYVVQHHENDCNKLPSPSSVCTEEGDEQRIGLPIPTRAQDFDDREALIHAKRKRARVDNGDAKAQIVREPERNDDVSPSDFLCANDEYTVGWICSLPLEMAAAKGMMDELHGDPKTSPQQVDQNTYILGRIGKFDVVVACPPKGEVGFSYATAVARDMLHAFLNIRIILFVGIGSGIPDYESDSIRDVRLGDVVISDDKANGGVVFYDFRKTRADGSFQAMEALNRPPRSLRTAISLLEAEHHTRQNRICLYVDQMLEKYPYMRWQGFTCPGHSADQLFQADYPHVSGRTCAKCDPAYRIKREPENRPNSQHPAIHYGLIAAGFTAVKDIPTRNEFRQERRAICLEMEAAGLMSNFPCAVVRGISDYADTHKSDRWQPYAAATAAACAKELLEFVRPEMLCQELTAKEIMSPALDGIAEDTTTLHKARLRRDKIADLNILNCLTPVDYDPEVAQKAIPSSEKRRKIECNDAPTLAVRTGLGRLPADAYTVGWICAITTEYTAAQEFLDEVHERPQYVAAHDNNKYTLGRVGNHNVVIAVLGEYVTTSAASVARDMLHGFPNVKIRLLVGIGSGAPSRNHDIRLGDIVVSTCQDGHGGVFHYDFGKTMQYQSFRTTGFLSRPPMLLQKAVNALKAQYESEGHCLEEAINGILVKKPKLWPKYKRPDSASDRLYESSIIHPPNKEASCAVVCGEDHSNLIRRQERTERENNPAIHYGLIASTNQVMKDASVRDILTAEKDVLCFEMAATGLTTLFPCLVIRGICDYSDSHKNKEWHGYAALAAAAYAKDILRQITPYNDSGVPSQPVTGDSQSLNDEQKQELLDSLRFDQIDARQMTIKNAHARTCQWLLQAPQYVDWLQHGKLDEHHGLLWIKGKPGAGKSTLMKFALANTRKNMKNRIAISFFFNARGDILERSTIGMYQSLLLQLLERRPELQDVFGTFGVVTRSRGPRQWSVESLKELLEQAVLRLRRSSVLCFIDALDECDENQTRDMVSFFEHVGELTTSANISFLVCFSSRHYPHITVAKGLNLVLEGQEGHRQDITCYLNSKLKIGQSSLAKQIRIDVQERASGVFLWVVLVVETLNKEHDRGRIHALKKKLQHIPGDLHELFRDILTRDDVNRHDLLLCIQWVLFAREPLRPEQLYFAILSGVEPEAVSRWNPDEITPSVINRHIVDCSKGLAEVTKSKNPTVRFIHESVRDFLLEENEPKKLWPHLGRNFEGESHQSLTQCCLNYMNIDIYTDLNIDKSLPKASSQLAAELRQSVGKSFPFLEYAVRNILYHADAAEGGGVQQTAFLEEFQLVDWVNLDNLLQRHEIRRHTPKASLIYILAEHNLVNLIRSHPSKLSCFEVTEDERYGPPIFAALATGSIGAVRTFLEAQVGTKSQTSPVYDLLEKYYQNQGSRPAFGRNFIFSPRRGILSHLAENGDEALIAAFLLSFSRENVDSKDNNGQTPLLWAAHNGREVIVKLLLERDANVEIKDGKFGQTPLSSAASNGHEAIVKLLLETGRVDVDSMDSSGRTPLSWAAEKGHEIIVKLLVETGRVDVEAKDNRSGQTPLSLAASNGHEAIVKLLLKMGRVDVEAKDKDGQTPLSLAASAGHEAVVKLLLETGRVDVEAKDKDGQTPLLLPARDGHDAVINLLLDKCADVDIKDDIFWSDAAIVSCPKGA